MTRLLDNDGVLHRGGTSEACCVGVGVGMGVATGIAGHCGREGIGEGRVDRGCGHRRRIDGKALLRWRGGVGRPFWSGEKAFPMTSPISGHIQFFS